MFKNFMFAIVALSFVGLSLTSVAEDAEKKDKQGAAKAVCPVSGKPCKKEVAVDYKDGQVFFCCPGCPGPFAKNTEKYSTKANQQLLITKQYKQVACPISGRPSKAEHAVTVNSIEVAFCCPNCKGKVAAAEGEEKAELVFGDKAFAKGYDKKEKKQEKAE